MFTQKVKCDQASLTLYTLNWFFEAMHMFAQQLEYDRTLVHTVLKMGQATAPSSFIIVNRTY